jgi:hypothetical protein
MDLLELPADTLTHLLTFLDLKSLAVAAQTCSQLKGPASSETVWQHMCRPWSKKVNLQEWRAEMHSYKALYRLLRDLERLVRRPMKGSWKSFHHEDQSETLF